MDYRGVARSCTFHTYPFITLWCIIIRLFQLVTNPVKTVTAFLYLNVNNTEVALSVTAHTAYYACTSIDSSDLTSLIFEILSVVILLLIVSGNVERNPGPDDELDLHCLSIYSQNIRSIRNKLSFIQDNWLDFDVLCFTESHLDNSITDETIQLENFTTAYRKDGTCHSGGILIYISDHLISTRKHELENYLPESIWVELKIKIQTFYYVLYTGNRMALLSFGLNLIVVLKRQLTVVRELLLSGILMRTS